MELSWTVLFAVLAAAGALGFWHSSLAARELANSAAQDACERLRLQFLDGTVAFASLALQRGWDGRLTLRRTYVFDYTADSIERRQGFIILAGRHLESVGFGHETSAQPVEESTSAGASLPGPAAESNKAGRGQGQPGAESDSSNVLDFAEWRRRSRQTAHRSGRDRGERNG